MGSLPRWPHLLCAGQGGALHGHKPFNFSRGVGAASQKRGGVTWPQNPEFVGV